MSSLVTKSEIMERVHINPSNGCWEWTKSCFSNGYGQIKRKGKNLRVHRESYKLFVGEIPDNLIICHRCNNPRCCNPDHLYAGTHKDNYSDSVTAGTSYLYNLDQSGERNLQAKNSKSIASSILEDYLLTGMTQEQLAKKYGISRRSVGRSLSGNGFS